MNNNIIKNTMEEIKLTYYFSFKEIFCYIFMIFLPIIFIIIFGIKDIIKEPISIIGSIFLFCMGLFLSIISIITNISKKNYFIINKQGITRVFFKKKYLIKWVISYSIKELDNGKNYYLDFHTNESIKNNGIKSKNAIRISTKYLRDITINDIIDKIKILTN
jgi:hypothetical protein